MATKRIPGAKIGAPKKIKAPKRARGRPEKQLSDDFVKYIKAFIQAHIDHQEFMKSQGLIDEKEAVSANKIAETTIALVYGHLPEPGTHFETKDGQIIYRHS